MLRIVHANLIQIHIKRTIGTAKRTENVEFDMKRCVREFNVVNKETVSDNVSVAVIEINTINEKSSSLNEDK